jgi:hypothetical protein
MRTAHTSIRATSGDLLGSTAVDLITRIIASHTDIETVSFAAPTITGPLTSRLGLGTVAAQIIQRAQSQWRGSHLPAWDAIMLSLINTSEDPGALFQAATFHRSISDMRFPLDARTLTNDDITRLATQLSPDAFLSLCPEAQLTTHLTKHIPMLDFCCPISDRGLFLARRTAEQLIVGQGVLVRTDRSYHLYGLRLLSPAELYVFLARALMFVPIVDRRWIAHQMIDGCCNLRITPRSTQDAAPTVVAIVG